MFHLCVCGWWYRIIINVHQQYRSICVVIIRFRSLLNKPVFRTTNEYKSYYIVIFFRYIRFSKLFSLYKTKEKYKCWKELLRPLYSPQRRTNVKINGVAQIQWWIHQRQWHSEWRILQWHYIIYSTLIIYILCPVRWNIIRA